MIKFLPAIFTSVVFGMGLGAMLASSIDVDELENWGIGFVVFWVAGIAYSFYLDEK